MIYFNESANYTELHLFGQSYVLFALNKSIYLSY